MSETFLLFAEPSFIEGMSRVLDLGNTLREYNESLSPKEADSQAIFADWSAIGRDIHDAILEISKLENVQEKSLQK
ncbi:MAG: hypothetical protein M1495_14540 [Bacteroidetes bacterium]|nr:hypothetical protein [Bacteroidota bacterium]